MPELNRPSSNACDENVKKHIDDERKRIEDKEEAVVINSDESFPASDPPSWTPVGGVGSDRGRRKGKKDN